MGFWDHLSEKSIGFSGGHPGKGWTHVRHMDTYTKTILVIVLSVRRRCLRKRTSVSRKGTSQLRDVAPIALTTTGTADNDQRVMYRYHAGAPAVLQLIAPVLSPCARLLSR